MKSAVELSALETAKEMFPSAFLDQSKASARTLYSRDDADIARCVLMVEIPETGTIGFKHALRPWSPEKFKEQFDFHVAAYDAFPKVPNYSVLAPIEVNPAQQCAVFQYAPGQNLRDHLEFFCPTKELQLQMITKVGRWLDHFHRSQAWERKKFSPVWAVKRYLEIRDGVEAGRFDVPAQPLFLRGIDTMEALAPQLRGKETVFSVQHGDFHMGNLIWDGETMTGIDISAGHIAPVGHDINKFLIDFVRRFRSSDTFARGVLCPQDVIDAFFEGYRLVGPNDPSVQLFAFTQVFEAWMLVPKERSFRTKAKQLCLQQLRPIAKQVFANSDGKRELRVLLTKKSVLKARNGKHAFTPVLRRAARRQGWRMSIREDSIGSRNNALKCKARTVFHMSDPIDGKSMCFRKVYADPFWQIEKVGARWHWDVARDQFEVKESAAAATFFNSHQKRLGIEKEVTGRRGSFIYMPLQGKLLVQRSFQQQSPIEMIKTTLKTTGQEVIATLHPNEIYSEGEMSALAKISKDFPQFKLLEMDMHDALKECDFVVTQNSSVGFFAFFYEKPVILFADIDFHHICLKISELGPQKAFQKVTSFRPMYEAYVHWFWTKHAINIEDRNAGQQLEQRMQSLGV